MGYNGNNRGRSNGGYKGFSKSSMRRGNSILFGNSNNKRNNNTPLFPMGEGSEEQGGYVFIVIIVLIIGLLVYTCS